MKKITMIACLFCFSTVLHAQVLNTNTFKNIKLKPAVSTSFLNDKEKLQLLPATKQVNSVSKKVVVSAGNTTDASVTLSALSPTIVTNNYMRFNDNGYIIITMDGAEKSTYTFELNIDASVNKVFLVASNGQTKPIQSTNKKLLFTLDLNKGYNAVAINAKDNTTGYWDFINAQIAKLN